MSLSSYIQAIFYRLVAVLLLVNLFTVTFLFYHYAFDLINKEQEAAKRLLEAEKSYLLYNLLSDKNSKTLDDFIEKTNKELNLIRLSKKMPSYSFMTITPFDLSFANKRLATIYPRVVLTADSLMLPVLIVFLYLILSFGALFIIFRGLKKKVVSQIVRPLVRLDKYFADEIEDTNSFPSTENLEITELKRSFDKILNNLEDYVAEKNKALQLEKSAAVGAMSKQVAHDIRSPLEALRSIANNLSSLDSMSKTIITAATSRISEIANKLLDASRAEEEKISREFSMRMLLEEIVHNKSRERSANIILKSQVRYSDSFVQGEENEFYRSISNLLNNAIEAQVFGKEIVTVLLKKSPAGLICEISDEGEGIEQGLLPRILKGGYSSKKEGNGMGLSTAKENFEKAGHHFSISSVVGEGTRIAIQLFTVKPPKWFSDSIIIKNKKVLCIDDDLSMQYLLRKLLQHQEVELEFSNGRDQDYSLSKMGYTCLIDFDLGEEKTGLDIIKEFQLQKDSFLVTSKYNDHKLQQECVKLDLKIIPKQILTDVEVIVEIANTSSPSKVVLIDDDDLIHLGWGIEAKSAGVELLTYKTVEEFVANSKDLPRETLIYIDSQLENGVKGEEESERIYELGFKKIFLATGYSPDSFQPPPWISKVVGKRPNFNYST